MASPFKRTGYVLSTENWRTYIIGQAGERRKVYIKVGNSSLALGVEGLIELAVGNVKERDLTDMEGQTKLLVQEFRDKKKV